MNSHGTNNNVSSIRRKVKPMSAFAAGTVSDVVTNFKIEERYENHCIPLKMQQSGRLLENGVPSYAKCVNTDQSLYNHNMSVLFWAVSIEQSAFKQVQNVQLHIIQRMRKDLSGPLLTSYTVIHSIVNNGSGSGEQRPWSYCTDAQVDLGLRCPHMPEDIFFLQGAPICPFAFINVTNLMDLCIPV